MGCYGLFFVTRTAIVTSQWYDRYCFTEYARTWARHPTTPWQRECTAITDRQSIDSLLDSMRFVTHFWEITPFILRSAIVVLVQYQCYSINARALGPRTPYRVGGLAGDVMRAWASHSLVNHWIYTFEASLLSRLLYICTGWKEYCVVTWYGQADVPREVSGRGGPHGADLRSTLRRSALRPLTSLGTSAWPYCVTTQYSYHICDIHKILFNLITWKLGICKRTKTYIAPITALLSRCTTFSHTDNHIWGEGWRHEDVIKYTHFFTFRVLNMKICIIPNPKGASPRQKARVMQFIDIFMLAWPSCLKSSVPCDIGRYDVLVTSLWYIWNTGARQTLIPCIFHI